MTPKLSEMQRRYIWLAGSYPSRVLIQGRGKRTPKLLYALSGDDLLFVFGYSYPALFLARRGLLRLAGANHSAHAYVLTEAGEDAFNRLLGNGGVSSTEFHETVLKEEPKS